MMSKVNISDVVRLHCQQVVKVLQWMLLTFAVCVDIYVVQLTII